ncbi:MAG: GNAT family N-acetyltransferase [Armatimonas sp.]
MLDFAHAVRVFIEGFTFTKSWTHPFLYESPGENAWRMYDAPRTRKKEDYRSEELVIFDRTPEETDALSRTVMGGRHRVCFMLRDGQSDTEMRAAFKKLGYRLMTTEGFFVHGLKSIPAASEPPVPVVRVTTLHEAEILANAALRRQILPEHLTMDPPPMRQYMALEDEQYPVGWVGSVSAAGCGWCHSMFVMEPQRRKGIGRSLMLRMLQDDAEAGNQANVLLASHAGAKLYDAVGYQRLGTLYMYVPPRK